MPANNVDEIALALRDLEARIARLERLVEEPLRLEDAASEIDPLDEATPDTLLNPTLIGRIFIVLGGAYLLRALTESGTIAIEAGIASGVVYATIWLVLAYRAASFPSATYHGIAAMLIGHPLLIEAVTRFQVMPPEAAAAGMTLLALAGLAIGRTRDIRSLAWASAAGSCVAFIALAVAARHFAPSAAALLVVALAATAVEADRGWRALSWAPLAVADTIVLAFLFFSAIEKTGESRLTTTLIALSLFLVSLCSVLLARRIGSAGLDLAQIAQTSVAVPIGLTGSALIAGSPALRLAIGHISLLIAVVAYGAALRDEKRLHVGFYATLGIVVGLHGGILAFPDATSWLVWLAIGLGGLWLADRGGRALFALHAAIALLAAAFASGAVGYAAGRLLTAEPARWSPLSVPIAVTAAVLLFAVWLAGFGPIVHRHRLAQALLLALASWCIAGFAIELAVAAGEPISRSALSALRTMVIVLVAIVLSWLSRIERLREASYLVTPLLLLVGAKLIVEDFRVGAAATLFVSLACYGTAIVLVSTVLRKRSA